MLLTHSAIVYPGRVQNSSPEVTLSITKKGVNSQITSRLSKFYAQSCPEFTSCDVNLRKPNFLPPYLTLSYASHINFYHPYTHTHTHFLSLLSSFSLHLLTAYLLLPFFSLTSSFTPSLSFYSHAYLVHLSLFTASISFSLNFPHRRHRTTHLYTADRTPIYKEQHFIEGRLYMHVKINFSVCLSCRYMDGRRYNSTHSKIQIYLEMTGQLRALAVLN